MVLGTWASCSPVGKDPNAPGLQQPLPVYERRERVLLPGLATTEVELN